MILDVATLNTKDRYHYLQHAVAPRPIAFASTINLAGQVNLSPFSYFNIFSAYPPILVFSPSRRARDNSNKHTLLNMQQVPEVVINMVVFDIVQQMSLSSCEYPAGVNEFRKAGLTEEAASIIKPPLVKESKIKFECRVNEIKPLGTAGGAGNLVICEILVMHIADELLDENKQFVQQRMQHVARLGGDWYCKVTADNLFEVPKPNTALGIGIDALPAYIKESIYLNGNELAQLANVDALPLVQPAFTNDRVKNIMQYYSLNPADLEKEYFNYAKELITGNEVQQAWQVLYLAAPI